MKKITLLSLVAATSLAFGNSTADKLDDLQTQIDKLKKQVSENKKQSANNNIKWGVDFRTSIDNINYDMADGTSKSNDSLYSMRLWLNMAYAPDENNIFKGQLAYNKAFGADFATNGTAMPKGFGMDAFDWVTNEALSGNSMKLKEAYWLYLGDDLFGSGMNWTVSVGRRPSTNGFLASLSQDDEAQSPLGHVINVEFDGASAMVNLEKVTGVTGMSFKLCLGQGSTNAEPMFSTQTSYAENANELEAISLAGFIFVPYDDGQYKVMTTYYRAYDLPGYDMTNVQEMMTNTDINLDTFTGIMGQFGDIDGMAISMLVNGLAEDGYLADVKLFASYAQSITRPAAGNTMLGSADEETGSSFWAGAYLPVGEGTLGVEYNHGDEYWRPFTYAEDTMIGSKIAARGDAFEINYTYQINKALSLQARYVNIDYEYTGSNGFFGAEGSPMKIDDVKAGAAAWASLGGTANPASGATVVGNLMGSGMTLAQATQAATEMGMAATMLPNVVESAQDFRFYLRYRF